MGNFELPSWMQSLVHREAPAPEIDPADLGTVLGLEASLVPMERSFAPAKKSITESKTDFGDLYRY